MYRRIDKEDILICKKVSKRNNLLRKSSLVQFIFCTIHQVHLVIIPKEIRGAGFVASTRHTRKAHVTPVRQSENMR
jgi:hypothetical protein